MTILAVVQRAATVLGLDVPTLLYGSTEREWIEMQDICNEMAMEIASSHDWQVLRRIHVFSGDGTSEAFALPADYDRMLKTASMWSSRWFWSINHIGDADQWLELQVVPIATTYGNWIVYGDELHILPVMESTETVKYFYISDLLVTDEASDNKTSFDTDTDEYRLSDRLLKLAIISRWKQTKGLPYAEALEDFQRNLALDIEKDQGSKPIISAQPWASWRGKNIAWPGSVTGAP